MTVLLIPRRGRLSNSQGRIEIDRTNPLTHGMLEFTLATPNGLISSSTGAASTNLGTTRLAAHTARSGVGRRSSAVSSASSEEVSIDLRGMLQSSPITIYCRGMLGGAVAGDVPTNYASSRHVYGITADNVTGFGICASNGTNVLVVGGNLGANRNTGNLTVATNTAFDAFGESTGGASSVLSLYVVGVGSSSSSAFGSSSSVFKPGFAVTGINLSTSTPGDKIMFYGAVWNRLLTAADRQRVAENPMGLIRARPWTLLAPGTAAGGFFYNPISGRGGAAAQPVIHN